MAIGKKLMILICCTCAASVALLICIAAPAMFYLASSGKQLCVPGVSIRCHESDCGSHFQRCGSNALLEVPVQKVCYRGALLPASETGLYSCPSTITASNSSQHQDRSSGLATCNCNTCAWPDYCRCLACLRGTQARTQVNCGGTLYATDAVAGCCLQERYSSGMCSTVSKPHMWETAIETVQRHFTELFTGRWHLQDFADGFTFEPASLSSCGCPLCGPGCG